MAASITSISTPASLHHHPNELLVTAEQGPRLAEGRRKQKKPSTKSFYQLRADKRRARYISAPRTRAHPHASIQSTPSPYHLSIFRSLKFTIADKHIERTRHHLFSLYLIISGVHRMGKIEGSRQQTRVRSSSVSSFPFLSKSFSFYLLLFFSCSIFFFLTFLPFVGLENLFCFLSFPFISLPVTRSTRRLEAHWRKRA